MPALSKSTVAHFNRSSPNGAQIIRRRLFFVSRAEEKNLGILAKNKDQVIAGIRKIKKNYNNFQEQLDDFSKNFVSNGAETTAKIVNEVLDPKK